MAESLQVDPVGLNVGSAHLDTAAQAAAAAHTQLQSGLSEASAGWIGESRQALSELADHWAERHSARHAWASAAAQDLSAAATSYTSTDDSQAEAVDASMDLGF